MSNSKLEPARELEGEAEEEDEGDVLGRLLPRREREADGAVPLGADGHHHEHRHALDVQGQDGRNQTEQNRRLREYLNVGDCVNIILHLNFTTCLDSLPNPI